MPGHDLDLQIHETLETLYERLDVLESDKFDIELSDGKLVLEVEDGPRIIVNRQGAAGQVWVAEPGGGWHFDLIPGEGDQPQRWMCAKRDVELFASLSELLTHHLGQAVALT